MLDMSMIDDSKNKAATAIYAALPSNLPAEGSTEDPDLWSTPAAVAMATGLKPATASGILLRLVDESVPRVERIRRGRGFVYRRRVPLSLDVNAGDFDASLGIAAKPAETAAEPSGDASAPARTRKPRKAASGAAKPVNGRAPRKAAVKAAAPAGPTVTKGLTCTVCDKPAEKVGRVLRHSHPSTEKAADHKATTAKLAGRKPMKGTCTTCRKGMTKSGRSWGHDQTGLDAAHKPTAAQPKTGAARNPAPVQPSTIVAADLGAALKERFVERAGSDGLSMADALRAAVTAYCDKPRRGRAR